MTGFLLDDGFDFEDFNNTSMESTPPICGLEHPRLEGNYCILDYDHKGSHEDAAGNEWNGKPAYD